ncbi:MULTISPECIES: phosphodiester glycosidase family protein [unclassified Streptomyces]|uniref:phosphodiester glycosidase family protein n=1 Tax=unclassified Streptomyces TaxID=2593676 RepID=UPI00278C3C89|nr:MULTISPECIES: phosphodiester glycosidase family protein [unclassified Streptomyces]
MSGRWFGTGTALCALALVGASAVPASSSPPPSSSVPWHGLPLGAAGLTETRTTRTLQPGVTLTRIVRGADAPAMAWTVEVSIPGGAGSPDPDAPPTALKDEASAAELASGLRGKGFDARSEEVTAAATADYAGGTLGWRVRVGTFPTEAAATAERTRLRAAGYTGSAWYTGWDGNAGDRGPWRVDVLTVDPKKFRGGLKASYGPDLENRETTSALAAADGATAGVNAGFFVLDPKAGAPGDPAGVGVYGGRLLSEAVNGRPGLVVHDSARGTKVERFTWQGSVAADGTSLALDGVDRVPGLIRNCGGTADDTPTARPLHDTTCTDPDELVAFTPEFGKETPKGEGAEAVLDRSGRVVEVRSPRGGALPAGARSVQATGAYTARLTALAKVGQRLAVRSGLKDGEGRAFAPSRTTSVLNGGPELVRDGRRHITPATDGMVQPGNPSFYYGWVHKRNPRTLAGTDAAGRTVLVTADGRSTGSLGLSIDESAAVARSLGLRDAMNLDGGGSTTMVVDGRVINDPSDAAGERPVGDALLVLPEKR